MEHFSTSEICLRGSLQKANETIGELTSPADRPRLVFSRWGQIPADNPVAIPTGPTVVRQFVQNGFHFINDGGPAHDVTIEPFKFDAFEARSAIVHRIGREGGFALVWVAEPQHLQSTQSPGIWDLQEWMALAAVHAHPSSRVFRQDYTVTVRVTYRDGNDGNARRWYRSSATLAYIPSQRRLEFRDITHEKGSLTRPSS